MTAAPEEKFCIVSMLNVTQGITVTQKHVFLLQQNTWQSGDHQGRRWQNLKDLPSVHQT
ncbi:hypothetical protein [Calothrix anomala]|uniref:hypothetical protein n=1 Tax=Calothrix anomala TaxID=212351 RepID=UPI0016833764